MLFQLIAAYKANLSVNILQHDPVLQTLSTDGVWDSQLSTSQFFDRLTGQAIDNLQTLNQVLIDQA